MNDEIWLSPQANAIIADTIQSGAKPDSPLGLSFPYAEPASDSLLAAHRPVRAESAEEIFSTNSQLNPQIITSMRQEPLMPTVEHRTLEWPVSVALLVVLGYYVLILYRFRSAIGVMFRTSLSVPQTISASEFQSNEQTMFYRHSFLLLMLGAGITAMQYTADYTSLSGILTMGLFVVAIGVVFIFKIILNHICLFFSENRATDNIRRVLIHHVALAAVVYTPIAIASAVTDSGNLIAPVTLLAIWLYYIARQFWLFTNSGFGKLQWFLYICTVEILPLTLIWALAERY